MGLFLCAPEIHAQVLAWQWGARGGSAGADTAALVQEQVLDMTTDLNGNVYVLAVNTRGIADVDGHSGIGQYDRLSIASWSCDGTFRWMKTFGSGSSCNGTSIKADTLGGVYIAGDVRSIPVPGGPGYFDVDSVLSPGNKSMYLIKYDTSGVFQWLVMPEPDTVSAGAFAYNRFIDMDLSAEGDIYAFAHLAPGGYHSGAWVVPDQGFYIIRYNKEGVFLGATQMDIATSGSNPGPGHLRNMQNSHLKRDPANGRYYLAGTYEAGYGAMSFGSTVFNTSQDSVELMYLAAFDSSGNVLWIQQGSADINGRIASRPVLDQYGDLYIGGVAGPGNTFAGYTMNNSMGLSAVPFIMSVDSNGNHTWATHGATAGRVGDIGLAYGNFTVSLSGSYGTLEWEGYTAQTPANQDLVYLARFHILDGRMLGLDSITAAGPENAPTALTAHVNGNIYLGGRFPAAVFPAGDTLSAIGGTHDWFLAKFGTENCDCSLPVPSFSTTGYGNNTQEFHYSGTSYSSIEWDFGDGNVSYANTPVHTYFNSGIYIVCVTVTNDCGSVTYCRTINSGEVGVGNIPGFEMIRVYPNPATEEFIIEHTPAVSMLDIYNATGSLVQHIVLNETKSRVNVRNLAPGVYFMKFTDKKGRSGRARFVKQ